jgi:hypothetical protein
MYTISTLLGVYGVDYKQLTKHIQGVDNTYTQLNHATYIELDAFLRGEKVSPGLLSKNLDKFGTKARFTFNEARRSRTITITCSDGQWSPASGIDTLSRHFILLRDFFTEYPNSESIECPTLTIDDVRRALSIVLGYNIFMDTLTPSMLYTLDILHPVSATYYLLFDWEKMSNNQLLERLSAIPEDEKRSIIKSHQLRRTRAHSDLGLSELPPNVPILGCFPQCRMYLATEQGSKLVGHNGWALVNAITYTSLDVASALIDSDFSKDDFIALSDGDQISVVYALCDSLSYCHSEESRSRAITICTMLGIRHTELGNINREVCAPFHLLIENRDITRRDRDSIVKTLKHYGYHEAVSHERLR